MRNIFTLFLGLAMLAATLGCGLVDTIEKEVAGGDINSNANKTLGDRAVDVAVGDTKIGIHECDDVVETLNQQLNDPDENFVTKALKRTILNQFREQLKQSLEQNQSNREAVRQFCVEFKKNLIQDPANTNSKGK